MVSQVQSFWSRRFRHQQSLCGARKMNRKRPSTISEKIARRMMTVGPKLVLHHQQYAVFGLEPLGTNNHYVEQDIWIARSMIIAGPRMAPQSTVSQVHSFRRYQQSLCGKDVVCTCPSYFNTYRLPRRKGLHTIFVNCKGGEAALSHGLLLRRAEKRQKIHSRWKFQSGMLQDDGAVLDLEVPSSFP